MSAENHTDTSRFMEIADARSGSSLVPMLISGLVMVVIGMAAAWIFS